MGDMLELNGLIQQIPYTSVTFLCGIWKEIGWHTETNRLLRPE